jgi:predicted GNAT family acetyltransferase
MTYRDFAFAIKLTDTMNWDLTEKDLKLMMTLEPEGCFVTSSGAEKVGIITTIHFDRIGWIGNVIVNRRYRSKGIGSLLVKHAVDYLVNKSVTTIGLYSYVDTVPFYEKMGFKKNSNFIRLVGQGSARHLGLNAPERLVESDLQDVINLDKLCVRGSRERLLTRMFTDSRDLCYATRKNKRLVCFIMADWYKKEIGPWVCHPSYDGEAINLLKAVLNKLAGLEVRIGVPERKRKILNALKDMNFTEEFKVVRMYYGESLEDTSCLLAMESLERG